MAIAVNPLGATMGAEVVGVDLRALDEATFTVISDAFYRYQVLAIRGQSLSPAEQVVFSRRFGPLEDQLNADFVIPGQEEVLILSNDMKDGKPIGVIDAGDYWHSDSSHRPLPSAITVLHSIRNPQRGGDTEFSDMYRAYETLPDEIKQRITGRQAIHAVSKLRNKRVTVSARRPGAKDFYEEQKSIPDVLQPVVRIHPVTNRPALYVQPRFTIGIVGMAQDEADELLDLLFAHQIKREFLYRHKWQDGDVVLWDNRCVIHRATGGFRYPDVRMMHRTVVAGDAPF